MLLGRLTAAALAGGCLLTPAVIAEPAHAAPASTHKVDSHDDYWPGGIVGVDESVDSRYPGWVLLTFTGHITPGRGATTPRFSLRCTNAAFWPITKASSSYHRGSQILEHQKWVRRGSFYSCGFDRPGMRDDRGFWGKAG